MVWKDVGTLAGSRGTDPVREVPGEAVVGADAEADPLGTVRSSPRDADARPGAGRVLMAQDRKGKVAPTFSVIIPTYGRPRYLSEAVASVLDQTVRDLECLVVDDASPEPVEVPEDPRVRVIRRESNGGPAAARNTGLDHASGRFIAFLDDDDLFTPERLEIAAIGLTRAPVTICHARHLDATAGRNRQLEGRVFDTVLDDTTPHCGATAAAREVVVRFDERFNGCEDVDWWLRMARDAPVTTVPRLGLLVRRHDDPRHRTDMGARLEGSASLLEIHADYFKTHRRARAFRWRRIGHLALLTGDRHRARVAFTRSLRADPQPRTLVGLARSWRVRRRPENSGTAT